MDQQARAELFDSIITGLASLIAGADDRSGTVWPKAKLRAFDGFELLDERLSDDDDYILFASSTNDVPIWPMNARWGGPHGTDWVFKRISTLRPADWRGRLSRTLPRMIEDHEALVKPNGECLSSVAPLGLAGGHIVDCIAHNHPRAGLEVRTADVYGSHAPDSGDFRMEEADFRLACGIELRREYLWSVLLGEEGCPRARFVTDPLGVREAFRLRDIPPGRQRRAALRHWVSQHWRKRREISEADRVFVRAYLRGATEFGWNGLGCTIEPSREDLRLSRAREN